MRQLIVRCGHVAAAVILATLGAIVPAVAAERSGFGIHPSGGGDWFRFRSVPGQTIEESALLVNTRPDAMRVRIYPADGFTTPQGGFALQDQDHDAQHVGRWVSLQSQELRLEPGAQVSVPFRLVVPDSAEPGEYAGGILVEAEVDRGRSANLGKEMEVQLNVIERVGVRIYVTVEGQIDRRLETADLTWRRVAGGVEFQLPVENSGNVRLPLEGNLRLSGMPGEATDFDLTMSEELLPGSTAVLKAHWKEAPPVFVGRALATVEYGGESPLTEEASIRLFSVALTLGVLGGLALGAVVVWRLVCFFLRARAALRIVQASASTEQSQGDGAAADDNRDDASSVETSVSSAGQMRKKRPSAAHR